MEPADIARDLGHQLAYWQAGEKLAAEREKDEPAIFPAVVGGAVGVAPTIHGLTSRSTIAFPEPPELQLESVKKLQKYLQPGDILLTSKPGLTGTKVPGSLVGMDPYASHVEAVVETPAGKPPVVIHSHPTVGGAVRRARDLPVDRDVIIKRFKDPTHRTQFLKNLERFESQEEALAKTLGDIARRKQYDRAGAVSAGFKTIIPRKLRKLFAGKPSTVEGATRTFCSSLIGMASPICLSPEIPAHELLPQHIQKSPELATKFHYRAPRLPRTKAVEALLRAAPWLARAAVGAGLGYGAYRGIKALMD